MDRMDKNRRLMRSQEIANQVKAGSYIPPQIDLMETWYPVRPQIEKDPNAIEFIFSDVKKDKPSVRKVNLSSVPGCK